MDAQAAFYAAYVQKVTYAFKNKIIDEESQDAYNFEGLAPVTGATLNLTNEQVIQNLLSDGTSGDPNHPACTDAATGTVIGLSRQGYLPCDFALIPPYSDVSVMDASFSRTAPTTLPPHYTTGYSQITGVITFGSTPGNPFSLDNITSKPNFAYKVWEHLNRMSVPESSNNMMATTTRYILTANNTLEARIDLTQSNDIYVKTDGSVPFNNTQSMGGNSLIDVDTLVWGTTSSELDTNGNIQLGGGAGASSIYFDKANLANNRIDHTAAGMRILSAETTIDGDLRVTANTTLEGDTTLEGSITLLDSGVSLYATPQLIGYVNSGSVVPFPDCVDQTRQRIMPLQSANIPTAGGADALLGYYPDIGSATGTGWPVSLYNITEDGTRIPAGPDSRIGIITWCDE